MPKLSIITVNFNNKGGLIDTAKSVVAQTWTDYEWIIIDGGSTDGSVDVIKEYAGKTDKLVYWCSEPDGGIYQGMNKGIEKASGEYCWFLNSGDYAYKDTTLEEIFANEFDEDIVYGNMMMEKENGSYKFRKFPHRLPTSYFLSHYALHHQGMFTRTGLLNAKNKYKTDYKIVSDWIFCTEAICKEKASYTYIPSIFAISQNGGITNKKEFWYSLQKERKKLINELFSRKERFFCFFSVASFRIASWKRRIKFNYYKIIHRIFL